MPVNKKLKKNTDGTDGDIKQANKGGVRRTDAVFKRKLL